MVALGLATATLAFALVSGGSGATVRKKSTARTSTSTKSPVAARSAAVSPVKPSISPSTSRTPLRVIAPLCPSPASRRTVRTIFENRQPAIQGAASGPDRFSELASLITPVVEMAANCADVEFLNRLAETLSEAPESLSTDADGRPIWSQNGAELRLVSSELLMLSSRLVEAILSLPVSKRTPRMVAYVDQMLPVISVHVTRWLTTSKFGGSVGCTRPRVAVGHVEYILLLRTKSMGTELSYCNAIDDVDLLIMGTSAQLARAAAADPTVADLGRLGVDRAPLLAYLQKSAELLASRIVSTNLRDYSGTSVSGRDFDPGVWRDLVDDNQWAGYAGSSFPLSPTALLVPQVKDDRAGWDLSHARRLVPVLAAFRRLQPITDSKFPDDALMTGLANQLSYGTMIGTPQWPMFSNYLSGLNGWYRVIYRGRVGFGYGPSDIGNAAFLDGGYGLWGVWNNDLASLTSRMGTILKASDQASISFRNANIGLYWENFSRVGGLSTDKNNSWTLMRFESSAVVDRDGTRSVDSDADADGAPDYLEIQAGTDPRAASSGAIETALAAARAQRNLRPTTAAGASLDSDGDGIADLEELRCGTSPLDGSDKRPGCPTFSADAR